MRVDEKLCPPLKRAKLHGFLSELDLQESFNKYAFVCTSNIVLELLASCGVLQSTLHGPSDELAQYAWRLIRLAPGTKLLAKYCRGRAFVDTGAPVQMVTR